jgi:L-aspartate oxidase
MRRRVRALMWESVGIIRTEERLDGAAVALEKLAAQLPGRSGQAAQSHEALEIRNLVHVAALIVASARSRRESRGLHLNLDRPYRDNERFLRDTVIARNR